MHSPSAARPGPISDALRADFAAFGLEVCIAPPAHGLIEVYPHAALIEFMGARERLPYKAGKTHDLLAGPAARGPARESCARSGRESSRRWTAGSRASRRRLPSRRPDVRGWRLKAFEDRLDAVVCAAVAIAALDGRAVAYGDAEGAIWVPVGRRGLAMLKSGNIFADVGRPLPARRRRRRSPNGRAQCRADRLHRAGEPARLLVRSGLERVGDRAGRRSGPRDRRRSRPANAAPRRLARIAGARAPPGRVDATPTRRPSGSRCTGRAGRIGLGKAGLGTVVLSPSRCEKVDACFPRRRRSAGSRFRKSGASSQGRSGPPRLGAPHAPNARAASPIMTRTPRAKPIRRNRAE